MSRVNAAENVKQEHELGQELALEEELETKTWVTEWYSSVDKIPEPESEYVDEESGTTWVLLDTKIVEAIEEGETRTIYENQTFYGIHEVSEIPKELEREDGEKLFLTSLTQIHQYWKETVCLDILFLDYEAPFYMLEGHRIIHDDEKPQLEGVTEILLKREGLNPADFRVKEIRWKGGTFLDEQFGLCREAELIAECQVGDYQAAYEGKIEIEPRVQMRMEMTYGYQPNQSNLLDMDSDTQNTDSIVQDRIEQDDIKQDKMKQDIIEQDSTVQDAKPQEMAEQDKIQDKIQNKIETFFLLLRKPTMMPAIGLLIGVVLGGGYWIVHKKS